MTKAVTAITLVPLALIAGLLDGFAVAVSFVWWQLRETLAAQTADLSADGIAVIHPTPLSLSLVAISVAVGFVTTIAWLGVLRSHRTYGNPVLAFSSVAVFAFAFMCAAWAKYQANIAPF